MTDVQTNRGQKPRDVDYSLEVLDGDIPDAEIQRRSPLEDQLDKVRESSEYHNKWIRIGSYANGSAGTAAANVIRKRHGDKAEVEGWTIKPKRADDGRTHLYVRFTPGAIVEGARAAFEQRMKDRAAKYAAQKASRENGGKKDSAATTASNAPKPNPAPTGKPAQK